jgi:capsular exopolysaccharide synthesis family protein
VTIAHSVRGLRRQWPVVVLLAALSVTTAAAYTVRQLPAYAATAQLFVSVHFTDASAGSALDQDGSLVQQRITTYADILTSPTILDAVRDELRLPISTEALAGQVAVGSPPDTVLLNITVTDVSPARAAAIANAIARQFPAFVMQLETRPGAAQSPVTITMTRTATAPNHPISPRMPLNLALGLLIGLALGVGAAVLRNQLNTAIDGVAEVEQLTGAIPLGVVPYDPSSTKQPLVDGDQHTMQAEAFRILRTNLQFANVDHPPRVIVVTSPQPGEGKTTAACNVALTLALGGARVVLVDGDLRKPAVGAYLGISSAAGLTSVLAGQHELRDVVVSYGRNTLAVLPSGPTPPNPSELLGSQQMADLLGTLANHYDLVVIDAPPVLPVTDAAVLAAIADGAVLVLRHARTRREEAQRAIQALTAVNAKLLGTVLNFAPKRSRRRGYNGFGPGHASPTVVQLPEPVVETQPAEPAAPH